MDHEQNPEVKKQNKTADRKAYMREYMKQYNAKKTKRPILTPEEKAKRLRDSQKKYYDANRTTILRQKFDKTKSIRIRKLKDKLLLLET